MIDVTTIPYSNQPAENKKKLPVLFIVILIIVAVIGGIFILRKPKKPEEKKETKIVKNEPSPTKKPEIDKEAVKIQVLNGTGTPGQAGETVKLLTETGYDPDKIKTANADDSDNPVTTISVKDGFDEIASDIEDALKASFDAIEIESINLDKDSEFDVVITTGGEKFEASTPSPTDSTTSPTETPTVTVTLTPSPTPTP